MAIGLATADIGEAVEMAPCVTQHIACAVPRTFLERCRMLQGQVSAAGHVHVFVALATLQQTHLFSRALFLLVEKWIRGAAKLMGPILLSQQAPDMMIRGQSTDTRSKQPGQTCGKNMW